MANPKQIKLIHTLKSALALDDSTYRLILSGYGVESSKGLSFSRAEALIDDLTAKATASGAWVAKAQKFGSRPRNFEVPDRAASMGKIEACLAERKLPWSYAASMGLRICKKDALELCSPADLHKIVQAFGYDARRHGRTK